MSFLEHKDGEERAIHPLSCKITLSICGICNANEASPCCLKIFLSLVGLIFGLLSNALKLSESA